MNIKFGKEALELADRVLIRPGGKKIDEYIQRSLRNTEETLCWL